LVSHGNRRETKQSAQTNVTTAQRDNNTFLPKYVCFQMNLKKFNFQKSLFKIFKLNLKFHRIVSKRTLHI